MIAVANHIVPTRSGGVPYFAIIAEEFVFDFSIMVEDDDNVPMPTGDVQYFTKIMLNNGKVSGNISQETS